jgi:transposase
MFGTCISEKAPSDGRLCMSNYAAERAMRPLATKRRNWTSDEGGRRAAAIYTLIETAKLNDVSFSVSSL